MNGCIDLYVLSAVACKLNECLDTDQLNMLSANLQTLGDMLSVLALQKSAKEQIKSNNIDHTIL